MLNELITNVINYVEVVSNGNQLLAAALMGSFTVALSGAVGFVLWKAPTRVAKFFREQCVTSFQLGTHQWASRDVYNNLSSYIYENRIGNFSRTISLVSDWKDRGTLLESVREHRYGLGLGWHVFRRGLKIFAARKNRLEGNTAEVAEEIIIYSLGRSPKALQSLIEFVKPDEDEDGIRFFNMTSDGWKKQSTIKAGGLDSLALDEDIKDFFRKEIDFYLGNKERYYDMGLAWKVTFMLYGEPGTGKTSIIRALAAEFGFNICVIDLKMASTTGLINAIAQMPPRSILLFEDCDGLAATANRGGSHKLKVEKSDSDKKKEEKTEVSSSSLLDGLSVDLQGFLNVLDGVAPLDDVLVFMTTNHIEKIDGAIFRDGRTDHKIELPRLSTDIVNNYLNRIYKTTGFDAGRPMLACELSGVKTRAKMDVDLAKQIVSGEFNEHEWRKAS